jgi:hypothetical protein
MFDGIGNRIRHRRAGLLTALIFGTLQYHYRNRRASEAGGEIARERYRKNRTRASLGSRQ